jgi:hypothetical protein
MVGLIIYFTWLTIVNIVPKFHHAMSLTVMLRSGRPSIRMDHSARPAYPCRCLLQPAWIRLAGPPPPCQFVTPPTHVALKAYVVNICVKCFKCSRYMLQVFYMDVAKNSYGCCICCNGYTRILQVSIQNVSFTSYVCYKCFVWMLYMLQWPYTYVASVSFKCFICFKRMLQEVFSCWKCFMSRRRRSP